MFPPPQELKTKVFARLPDKFRVAGRRSEWAFGKENPDLHSFLEGPSFDAEGNLLVTDIPFGRVFKVSPDGEFDLIAEYDGEPNGMAIDRAGMLFLADHKNGIVKVDPATGAVEFVLKRLRREGFKGLNDLVFDGQGNLYFNDQGQTGMQDPSGRVYRLNTDDSVDCLIDTVPSPNGMAFSPDGKVLYVAATRANQVWRLPLHSDGSSTKASIFLQMQGGHTGPDGIAVDTQGNVVVCQCGSDSVWLFSPFGEPLYRIRSCAGLDLTNAAFGGPGNRRLYITEASSGQILVADLDVPGLPTFAQGA
jgi:gluconolactonase